MRLEDARARYPGAETFRFGDGPALSAECLALVRSGKKTATCEALARYEAAGDALPRVGRRDIALNWDGRPALVIKTLEVRRRRFCDVDADFALAEGEFESFEAWWDGHRLYFEKHGGWSPDMMLFCERFKLIEDFA